eukprot:COSAG02_NODE_66261_length_256_cov_0.541401_1_plen_52_part_10
MTTLDMGSNQLGATKALGSELRELLVDNSTLRTLTLGWKAFHPGHSARLAPP